MSVRAAINARRLRKGDVDRLTRTRMPSQQDAESLREGLVGRICRESDPNERGGSTHSVIEAKSLGQQTDLAAVDRGAHGSSDTEKRLTPAPALACIRQSRQEWGADFAARWDAEAIYIPYWPVKYLAFYKRL